MSSAPTQLALAIAAMSDGDGPRALAAELRKAGAAQALRARWELVDELSRKTALILAAELGSRGIGVIALGDTQYPERLAQAPNPPALLFYWGNPDLLGTPGVGMCGSRDVSERGLQAARACGEAVARQGLTVISGYAKGVDTETHLAALTQGGRTIIVLAEGFVHFRQKKAFGPEGLDQERVLVLSQFPPSQPWAVGAAMTRNGVIAALGRALVVIEAGESGGTINAGMQAIRMGRPVLALNFSEPLPAGNRILFDKGALPVQTPRELYSAIAAIDAEARQLSLPIN